MSEIFNWDLGTDEQIIGQPIAFGECVGHVVKFEGEQMKGCSSIIHVRTPHGTIIRCGRAHYRKPDTRELELLQAFVDDAKQQGKWVEPPSEVA